MELTAFFERQLGVWDEARRRYEQLGDVQVKHLDVDGVPVSVQYNPARIVSTGARIDARSLARRKCFLCPEQRPAEQISLTFADRYEVLVNPFPILPRHFTVPLRQHAPQSLAAHYPDLLRLVEGQQDYFVFYNGPRCGASAPDHMHFQMGLRGRVPLERDWARRYAAACQLLCETDGGRLYVLRTYVVPLFAIVTRTVADSERLFRRLHDQLPQDEASGEPMMNVLAWHTTGETTEAEHYVSLVIPRGKHRPDCYGKPDGEGFMVSPGALDMGGLVITPRGEDFDRIGPVDVKKILKEVALSDAQVERTCRKL